MSFQHRQPDRLRRCLALLLFVTAAIAPLACATPSAITPAAATAPAAVPSDAEAVRITLLQLNDIYEITPIAGGQAGGLARVATLRQRLLAENPNTLTLLAGDLLSPSALGTAKVDGERLDGRQMVAVLDRMGLDLAAVGNHELDLGEASLRARLSEARFTWLAANLTAPDGGPFGPVVPSRILELGGVRIGVFGALVTDNRPPYARVDPPLDLAVATAEALRPQVDLLIALTHLTIDEDRELVRRAPGIDIVLGGHEHENQQAWHEGAPIFKADANVRTVWVHDLWVAPGRGLVRGHSQPIPITPAIPEHPETAAEVARWVEKGFAGFRAEGFTPEAVIATIPFALDGREAVVRREATRLTDLLVEAVRDAAPGTVVGLVNSGSIRIDDVIPAGTVTEYDVIRVLPFGGEIWSLEVRGDLLAETLEQGRELVGSGGYLLVAGAERTADGRWTIAGEPLRADATYSVAANDYLASGRQPGLEIFTTDDPRVKRLGTHGDVRRAVIAALAAVRGPTPVAAN